MGYTQYWYREKIIDQTNYNKIITDFKKIREELFNHGVLLAGQNGDGIPIITNSQVVFNGSAESQGNGEPFKFGREIQFDHIRPRRTDEPIHQFTKTEGLPYNLAVMAFLIIAKHYLDGHIIVQSDGVPEDWNGAGELCQQILGYGNDFKLDK